MEERAHANSVWLTSTNFLNEQISVVCVAFKCITSLLTPMSGEDLAEWRVFP